LARILIYLSHKQAVLYRPGTVPEGSAGIRKTTDSLPQVPTSELDFIAKYFDMQDSITRRRVMERKNSGKNQEFQRTIHATLTEQEKKP